MQKYVSVHPVIYKIDNLGNDNYLVHETLKLLFIPISFKYPVTIEKNLAGKSVRMKATVFKWTKIEINFAVKTEGTDTIVDENVKFKSKLPVKFILKRIFRKQHNQLFKNIEMK
jgi:hypothetical protein